MELSSTLQLENRSLGDAVELSPPSSPTSLSPDSSPAPTLCSLPPELLGHIFDSIPTHPYYQRVLALSNLCLVNHLFLEISRPLLYHDVHLDLEMDFDWSSTRYNELYNTLTTSPVCSGLLNHLRVSFRESFTGTIDMVVLAYVLSHLTALKSVRTSWWHAKEDVEVSTEFVRAITRHQKRLERLEIPKVSSMGYKAFEAIFTELPGLKEYVGDLILPPESINLATIDTTCSLRRLVVTSDYSQSMLQQILSSSHASLTSLAFRFSTTDDPFDLSSFPNLVLLRLELYQKKEKVAFVPNSAARDAALHVNDTLRKAFASLRTLPLKTFSITTRNSIVEHVIKDFPLIDALPPSITHLGTIASLFKRGTPNVAILREMIRNRCNPHLKRISIFQQPATNMQIPCYAYDDQQTVKNEIEAICLDFDIAVETMAERDTTLHQGFFLDPWQSDSETESEDSDDEDEDENEDD